MAGRGVEAVHQKKGHQRQPEQHIEHDGRSDSLGAQCHAGVGTADPGLGEEPETQSGTRGGASRRNVAEGQGGHVDSEESEPLGSVRGEYGMGELGIGGQCPDLEEDAENQVLDMNVAEGTDFRPVTGQQRQGHVEDEQEDQDQPDTDPDLPSDERTAVPPPVVFGTPTRKRHPAPSGWSRWRRPAVHAGSIRPIRWLRQVGPLIALAAHSPHVGTMAVV